MGIVITDGWGYVVVYSKTDISLFNVNGRSLRKRELVAPVARITAWTCERGFDWMAWVDNCGDVRFCEAFFLDPGEPICRSEQPVIALSYRLAIRALLLVTVTGDISIVAKDLS
jgi:hypothetical protein